MLAGAGTLRILPGMPVLVLASLPGEWLMENAKFEWIKAVKSNAGPKSSTTRLVLMTLSTHMDNSGGSCFPSIDLLARETALSKKFVGLHLQEAVNQGWLVRESRKSSGQAWRQYHYSPNIPGGGDLDAKKVVTLSQHLNKKGGDFKGKGGDPEDKKVVTQGHTSISYSYSESISFLSGLLLQLILERRKAFKKPNLNTWSKDLEKMLRIDKRDPVEVESVIRWCQADPFWQNNVLSARKLREKYDQLCLKMNSGTGTKRKAERFMEEGYYD